MELLLVGAVLVTLGVHAATSPLLESPSTLIPRNAARMAVEEYNQEPGVQAVFRLLKLRNTHKTKFDWGVHFSMNFTVKETLCQKTAAYRIGDCRYKPNGMIRDCSADVSVLNFLQDSPLTSVKCQPLQQGNNPNSRNSKPNTRPQAMEAPLPLVYVETYFPSSFSTAALTAPEGE
ncbi:cathelicidin-2-like isoform X3 [Rhineura floridana]|uniref:cathelicidin-2-like isoform X3 n=1 Tax=Rhineura floridana TaxID=261503 RepID=UPI002AC85080|nr:cathelicidin-2-like isoform X3 [Rhineura floridana]